MSKLITVFGATGAQGGSVVAAFLQDESVKIRGVTRNVNSEAAKALKAQGVELVTADLNDEASLLEAIKGSNYIYAVTDFFEPFAAGGPDHAIKVESAQGINLARAASKTPTLEHFIWSTLPNSKKISGGKYVVPHFESKNIVDDYIKQDKNLYDKTTFLWNTFYAGNYLFPMFTPNFAKSSGKHIQLQPAPPTVPIYTIGDARANVGIFVRAVIAQPQLTLLKTVLANVESTTTGGLLETWSVATGKPSVYVQTSLEDFDAVWPMWGKEMGVMMQFWEEAQEKSWSGEDIITKEDLGIKEALVGNKEAFRGIDWAGVVA